MCWAELPRFSLEVMARVQEDIERGAGVYQHVMGAGKTMSEGEMGWDNC